MDARLRFCIFGSTYLLRKFLVGHELLGKPRLFIITLIVVYLRIPVFKPSTNLDLDITYFFSLLGKSRISLNMLMAFQPCRDSANLVSWTQPAHFIGVIR